MILDNLIAIRILYLLVTPFESQHAYKLGVIDSNGNALLKIKDMTPEQKTNYTMLHRLVFRLKKVLGTIPFGKTTLASFAAAYLLVKECVEQDREISNLEEIYENILAENKVLFEEHSAELNLEELEKCFSVIMDLSEKMRSLGVKVEDGPVTTTAGISANTPTIKTKQSKFIKMIKVSDSKFKKIKSGVKISESFADSVVIILNEDTDEGIVIERK